jgi:hypothetical protein
MAPFKIYLPLIPPTRVIPNSIEKSKGNNLYHTMIVGHIPNKEKGLFLGR